MERNYKNKNRGYQQLRVWQQAVEFYAAVCRVFRCLPFELKKVASQEIASADSVHRNIAEGYCRRSIREYLNFLNIALASLGESVSGLYACRNAQQINEANFVEMNALAFKLENGLLKLIEKLQRKQLAGGWVDHLLGKENADASNPDELDTTRVQHSTTPSLHHPTTPSLEHPTTPPPPPRGSQQN